MVKVSVVIPVYNCEKYVGQCIGSVLDQTLKELEVICVDDGSTDRSAEEVWKLALEDGRVRLLRQGNQGAGAARNLALENAEGKYVAFLDADDYYLDKSALESMYDACERNHVAASVSLKWCVDSHTEEVAPWFQNLTDNGILDYQSCQMDYNFTNYLFLRELLVGKEIFFPLYRRYEDPPFLAKALYKAEKFAVVDTCLYCYRLPDAVSRFNPEIMKDLLHGLMDNLSFSGKHGLDILFRNTVARLEYEYMFIILKNMMPDDLETLNLLIQANRIICDRIGNPGYVIRPLRGILLYASQYEKRLEEKIRRESGILLYGAGRLGRTFFYFLKEKGLSGKVSGFVVSGMEGNEKNIEGIPVTTLQDVRQEDEKVILVAAGGEKHREISVYLEENGRKNYEMVREEFLCLLAEELEREGKLCQK